VGDHERPEKPAPQKGVWQRHKSILREAHTYFPGFNDGVYMSPRLWYVRGWLVGYRAAEKTIIWSVTVAAVSLFRIATIAEDQHSFKNVIKDNLKLIVVGF
jgi:hypothetical protein